MAQSPTPTAVPAGVSGTADPRAARLHARAMAGTRVEAMPTLPASLAPDRPADVLADAMIWAETLAPGGWAARRLARGARLRLVDLEGDACAAMLVFNPEQTTERLNVADTMKIQWNAYLGPGSFLLSDLGRVMASVLADDTAGHDLICGASNAASEARRRRPVDGIAHAEQPDARARLGLGVARFGLGRRDIHPCVTWFKPVRVGEQGELTLDHGPFAAGRSVTLRADMDLIVVLANCPHPLDPRPAYSVGPLRALAWRGDPASADDPVRCASPEATRAFLNTDDWYRR